MNYSTQQNEHLTELNESFLKDNIRDLRRKKKLININLMMINFYFLNKKTESKISEYENKHN